MHKYYIGETIAIVDEVFQILILVNALFNSCACSLNYPASKKQYMSHIRPLTERSSDNDTIWIRLEMVETALNQWSREFY